MEKLYISKNGVIFSDLKYVGNTGVDYLEFNISEGNTKDKVLYNGNVVELPEDYNSMGIILLIYNNLRDFINYEGSIMESLLYIIKNRPLLQQKEVILNYNLLKDILIKSGFDKYADIILRNMYIYGLGEFKIGLGNEDTPHPIKNIEKIDNNSIRFKLNETDYNISVTNDVLTTNHCYLASNPDFGFEIEIIEDCESKTVYILNLKYSFKLEDGSHNHIIVAIWFRSSFIEINLANSNQKVPIKFQLSMEGGDFTKITSDISNFLNYLAHTEFLNSESLLGW